MTTVSQEHRFAQVPRSVIYHADLTGNDIRVYATLSDRAGRKGTAWPSVRRIAVDLGMSPTTVQVCLDRLETAKVIEVERDAGSVNHYHLPSGGVPESDTPVYQELVRGVPESDTELEQRTRPIEPEKTLPTVVSSEMVLFSDDPVDAEKRGEVYRDFYYEAACAALDLPHKNSDERPLGIIASKARKGHHQPDEILRRAALHLATFDFPFTPGSFVKRWDQLGSKVTTATKGQRKRFAAEVDRMRRRQQIVEGDMLVVDES